MLDVKIVTNGVLKVIDIHLWTSHNNSYNKIVLIEQWQSAIKKTLHLEPFVIKGAKCKIKPSLIYIVNAINLPKHDKDVLDALKIGLVIVDECHLILTKI